MKVKNRKVGLKDLEKEITRHIQRINFLNNEVKRTEELFRENGFELGEVFRHINFLYGLDAIAKLWVGLQFLQARAESQRVSAESRHRAVVRRRLERKRG